MFKIHDIEFSDDAGRIHLTCDLLQNIPGFSDADSSTVRLTVSDMSYNDVPMSRNSQPVLTGVEWTGNDYIREADICMLAMVDLTRPQKELMEVKRMLKHYYQTFKDNLFLTFMLPKGQLSYTMPATEYAINVYVAQSSALFDRMDSSEEREGNVYLLHSVSRLMERLSTKQTHTYLDSAANVSLVVFSGEEIFDQESNYPYDPDHFIVQETILQQLTTLPSRIKVSFLDISRSGSGAEDTEEPDRAGYGEDSGSSFMNVICMSTGGLYLKEFDTISFMRSMTGLYGVHVPDFDIFLDNRPGNIYVGRVKKLKVCMYSEKDSLLAADIRSYKLGEMENPVIVGEHSIAMYLIPGGLRVLLILLLAFLAIQIVLPSVRYSLFRRRYVVKYTGPLQSVNNIQIPDTCYLCKSPFKPGEKIVARCSHVVHEECWEENGQHCPEFGTSCQDGSHFYDKKHPYNRRNAPYYAKWVLYAIITSFIAWGSLSMLDSSLGVLFIGWFVDMLVARIDSVSMSTMDVLSARHYYFTLYAFRLAFCTTLVGSVLALHRRHWSRLCLEALFRSMLSASFSFVVFALQCIGLVAMKKYESFFILDTIPWFLSILSVEYAITFKSNVRPLHRKYLYSSVIIAGAASCIINPSINVNSINDAVNLVYGSLFYCISVMCVVAQPDHGRKNAYLHTTGNFKEYDIALYKWFNAGPSTVVTIGRSVDCSLTLQQDVNADVAPIHCSIRMVNGVHKLCISDNDVEINGHKAGYHKAYTLYYGDVFCIGSIRFRYLGI